MSKAFYPKTIWILPRPFNAQPKIVVGPDQSVQFKSGKAVVADEAEETAVRTSLANMRIRAFDEDLTTPIVLDYPRWVTYSSAAFQEAANRRYPTEVI